MLMLNHARLPAAHSTSTRMTAINQPMRLYAADLFPTLDWGMTCSITPLSLSVPLVCMVVHYTFQPEPDGLTARLFRSGRRQMRPPVLLVH